MTAFLSAIAPTSLSAEPVMAKMSARFTRNCASLFRTICGNVAVKNGRYPGVKRWSLSPLPSDLESLHSAAIPRLHPVCRHKREAFLF